MREWVIQVAIDYCQGGNSDPIDGVTMGLDEAWGCGIDDGSWLWTEEDVQEMVQEVEAALN